ncbi:MAG: efflux RND transporter periplasmic adaptor subunit [Bacteroidaceae bacterium]|nr:efflux RND transporter periplasmic adaptor subunit [Bacteroidaceae bacterium]
MKIKTLMAVATASVMLVACGEKKEQEQTTDVVKFEIMKLAPQSREINYAFPATLVGDKDVTIFPQVEGRILERHYNNGDFVKKGQALITIDPTPYRLMVESDAANVKAAEAALSTAKLQYESQQKLYEKKIVSDYVMKTAQNSYLMAQAQLAQANAALQHSKTDLAHCTVVAPISGVVTRMSDDIGLLIAPGMSDGVLSITDQTRIRARFSITEDTYTNLFRSTELTGGPKGIQDSKGRTVKDVFNNIKLRMKDGVIYDKIGMVINIGGTVDSNTGTVLCEVSYPNPNLILHAGNTASVIFPDHLHNVLVIPQTACKKLQNKYLVFKVNKNNEAVGVVVDVVPTDDGKEYIVTSDALKNGDEIVTDGVARIQEGQKVR